MLEWESEVELLFHTFNVDEDDKLSWLLVPSLQFWTAYLLIEGGKEWGAIHRARNESAIGNSKEEQEMYISPQGIVKKETKKSSIVEESQRAIELVQVKAVVGALVEAYVVDEDSCDFKRKKSIEEENESEIKEKERVERKESLDEESYLFDSISSLFEGLENDECVQKEEIDLEKNERTKEMKFWGTKNQEERLGYNSIKIISFFPSKSYMYFLMFFKERIRTPRKELRIIHGDITMSFSLNSFSLCHEVSLGELDMLLVVYTSHVSIFGELCSISLDGNLFLLMPCMLKCLTPCVSLENQLFPNMFNCLSLHASFVNHLIPSEAKLDLLYFKHEKLHDDSFMEPKVVESWLACAIFYVLHARIEGKHIENNNYVLTFFATFT
ncbi:hypothetical protein M9H77_02070 [Catharanthus roseus]|uniref:Uncharacterized protein n=1 Tax=Catharanthus roseus TaxID=4058 RepID=A0ACC0C7A3_CATRO|nr:hypothetical protein M9H77_02070 [Catharanthus roseus]